MINVAGESRAWQLDMQLVGKVALSAAAVFLLALAYRFYKFRTPESADLTGKHGAGPTREEKKAAEAPKRNYINTGAADLRYRCVNNSHLQDSLVTDPGNKHLVDLSASAHTAHVKAQEGSLAGDAICRDQSGFTVDPLQSPREPDDAGCHQDECDGGVTYSQRDSESFRQDPEGREMFERMELHAGRPTRNVSAVSSIDLSISHENESKHELHTFSSIAEVQMQENILPEDENSPQPLAPGGLKGKVYHYHVESTSQSVTAEKACDPGVLPPSLPLVHIKNDFPSSEEDGEKEKSVIHQEETIDGEDKWGKSLEQINLSPKQDIDRGSDDEDEGAERSAETEGIGKNNILLAMASTSISNIAGQSSGVDLQSGPDTYHISLAPDSTFDIHLNLDNCYEVLCLAKRHKLDTLKAAAYKMMSQDYLQVLQNPSVFGRLNATERDLILESRMKGRRFVAVADIDTQAATASQNGSSLSYYDSDKDCWHFLSRIPIEAVSRGCSMATMFNYLFVVLGCDGPGRQMKPSKRVLCYNPLTDSWKEISSLNEARPHCKLVALDGYLYAIGGECLHTVERYDPRQNRWSYVAPLPNDTFAVAHMATAYDDEIFVTGGTIRYILLRYRHRDNTWKSSLVSGSKDRTTEMVAANNFLYRFDLNRSMGISVHRCNIRARIWYECASYAMPYPAPFHCVVIDNSIYCISRSFHLRFLTDDISPRFMELDLQPVPSPKGILFPLVLVLPVKDTHEQTQVQDQKYD